MPVELSPTSVERALALLGEHDLEAPGDVEGALELIAGREDEEALVEISRYDLQLFLWYQLPCKLLDSLEVKRAVAERLGRFLELAGDGATGYAEICTCEQTMAMLEAWEAEEPDTVERLREALEASGLEPPDTNVLRWRSMMGFEEARLRDRVARGLERWIEREGVDPRARGFKRRQAALVTGFLQRAQAELDGRAPLDVIVEERLESWVRDGGAARREFLTPVVPMLESRSASCSTVKSRRSAKRSPPLSISTDYPARPAINKLRLIRGRCADLAAASSSSPRPTSAAPPSLRADLAAMRPSA